MGTCSSITLKDSDYAHYITVYYSSGPGPIIGLKITTNLGQILTLGLTTDKKSLQYTFTFENNSLLVGFYGSMLDWQINSLGVIYLDPNCLPTSSTVDGGVSPTNSTSIIID